MARFRFALAAVAFGLIGVAAHARDIHVAYDVYAAGLHVAEVEADFDLDGPAYSIRLAYHTTGLVALFRRGHQLSTVNGRWVNGAPDPRRFYAIGRWGGEDRLADIDYQNGQPIVRVLSPPNEQERMPIPPELESHAIDTLSALALLMRQVEEASRCEAAAHTYDGRRVVEISARTAGPEVLSPTSRSIFTGQALRCDFVGRAIAGFRLDDSPEARARPLHGSAWFAQALPGRAPLPVRMSFETRWFGDATLFLTAAETPPATANRASPG